MRCTYSPQQAHWHSLWAETNAERVDETQATKAFTKPRIDDVLSCLYGLPGARSIDFITLPPIVTGIIQPTVNRIKPKKIRYYNSQSKRHIHRTTPVYNTGASYGTRIVYQDMV